MPTETIIKKLYGGEVEVVFYPNSHRYKVNGEWVKSVTGATGIIDKPALKFWACGCMRDELIAQLESGNFNEITIKDATSAFTRVSKAATDAGSLVHDFCEAFAKYKMGEGEKPSLPTTESLVDKEGNPLDLSEEESEEIINNAVAGCGAFLKWVIEYEVEFVAVERFCYSRKHNFVGTLDLLYRSKKIGDFLILADYKTSKGFYPFEMGMQTGGYKIAYEEETLDVVGLRQIIRFDKVTGDFEVHDCPDDEEDEVAFLNALQLKKRQDELDKLYRKKK